MLFPDLRPPTKRRSDVPRAASVRSRSTAWAAALLSAGLVSTGLVASFDAVPVALASPIPAPDSPTSVYRTGGESATSAESRSSSYSGTSSYSQSATGAGSVDPDLLRSTAETPTPKPTSLGPAPLAPRRTIGTTSPLLVADARALDEPTSQTSEPSAAPTSQTAETPAETSAADKPKRVESAIKGYTERAARKAAAARNAAKTVAQTAVKTAAKTAIKAADKLDDEPNPTADRLSDRLSDAASDRLAGRAPSVPAPAEPASADAPASAAVPAAPVAESTAADNPFAVDISQIGTDADLDARSASFFARIERERSGEFDPDRDPDDPRARRTTSDVAPKRRDSRPSKGFFGFEVETDAGSGDSFYERWVKAESSAEVWRSQILPQGVMYPSYLADPKEARLASDLVYDDQYGGTLWEGTFGGRVALFRFGTTDVVRPEGWELEVEGAARLRLDLERDRALAANEFRFGLPIVYGTRRWQFKTGYSRVDSRLGDGYLQDGFRPRRKYARDSLMFGLAFKPVSDVRLYAETDVAFRREGAAEPLELLLGAEYSPQLNANFPKWVARPFLATSARLYQERDFGGFWSTQTGAQWRSETNGLLRAGFEFSVGNDDVYQFQDRYQRKYGIGLWYDF